MYLVATIIPSKQIIAATDRAVNSLLIIFLAYYYTQKSQILSISGSYATGTPNRTLTGHGTVNIRLEQV